jgi:hypothetical protein
MTMTADLSLFALVVLKAAGMILWPCLFVYAAKKVARVRRVPRPENVVSIEQVNVRRAA